MEREIPKVDQTYRHQNGHAYVIIAIARDDYTEQDLVIHQGLHDNRVWSRPMNNFLGLKDGKPRFVR